jgi:hypothetical protein
MASMQKEVVRAYRSLLRGAFKVFHNDPRMKLGARMGAKDVRWWSFLHLTIIV